MRQIRLVGIGAASVIVAGLSLSAIAADPEKSSGTAVDDAYAAKLWAYMLENKLIGDGRVRSFPFVGSRPHGSIQELTVTEATIDGQKGRLLIKHNYGAEEELTPKKVYAADHDEYSEPLAIMFQREEGYDATNNNWFWAEYKADGSVFNYQGANLSGRAPLCLGCHTALGGDDREVLNGTTK